MSISIVMLCFNQLEFLHKAIHSVLLQDSVDLQLIIVDPGSTDGSREFAQSMANQDHRITLIFDSDSGPADGLNKGFKLAQSEIFGYLNSDDMYLPSVLKNVEKFFKLRPEADVIYGHGLIIDEINHGKVHFAYSDEFSKSRIATGTTRIMQQSTFFRKASIDEARICFNSENSTCWDYEFVVDCFMAGLGFLRIDQIFGVLRIHSRSITGQNLNRKEYLVDKNRITAQFCSRYAFRSSPFQLWFSICIRAMRKFQEYSMQNKFKHQVREFRKSENCSFME